jgi:penicillin-binding protein 2
MAERRLFRGRALFMSVFIFLLLCVLAGRIAYLQTAQYEKYKLKSDKNRVQIETIPPPRGLIYDRNGVLLAENISSHTLIMVKERVKDVEETLAYLKTIIDISEREERQFRKNLERRERPYEKVVIKSQLKEEDIAQVMVNRPFLPGIDIEARLIRHYPHKELYAHGVGYVGKINDIEKPKLDPERYKRTTHIGKVGAEKTYESTLHGEVGYRVVEVNAKGRFLRTVEEKQPIPGDDLVLTLDSRLQNVAAQEMSNYRGAVVAIDVNSGGILASYSNPNFDPNLFVVGIPHKTYNSLNNDIDKPFVNRAVRGRYPPGSTIKPFVGLAFLEAGTTNWSYAIEDGGFYQLENDERLYRDWKRDGHGEVDLRDAMIESCDTYFYEVSVKTGVDQISSFLAQFGFGRNMALDVQGAIRGVLPDRVWKKKHRGRSWYAGDTLNMSIGQGFMVATPLQLATATAILARKGKALNPQIAEQAIVASAEKATADVVLKNDNDWQRMFNAMEGVITARKGTARSLRKNLSFSMAGKTGTAQVVGIAQDAEYDSDALDERKRDHALFVAFAPVENPSIAIAVIVENGESASRTAGPVAKAVMQEYLLGAQG